MFQAEGLVTLVDGARGKGRWGRRVTAQRRFPKSIGHFDGATNIVYFDPPNRFQSSATKDYKQLR